MLRLPLLSFVSDKLYPDVDLEGVLVIACQHILATVVDLFQEMFDKGLDPKDVFLLGKCYSTNYETMQLLREKGVRVSELSESFNSHESFDNQFSNLLKRFFREVQKSVDVRSYRRIIILDDGGHLIATIHDFFKGMHNIVGVEQTSSGFHKLKGVEISFPIINVARSETKLVMESPLIADLVETAMRKFIRKKSLQAPRVLVIGQGPIGRAIVKSLRLEFETNGCDIQKNRCDFRGSYKEHIADFDVIIGATGKSILGPKDFSKLKKGVVLISASSSDREFESVYLRSQLPKSHDCHADVVVNGITLLNSGFPVNFTGDLHSLPPNYSQLPRALMLAGAFQAMNVRSGSGMRALYRPIQEKIGKMFYQYALRVNKTISLKSG